MRSELLRNRIVSLADEAELLVEKAHNEQRDLTEEESARLKDIAETIGQPRADGQEPTGLWAEIEEAERIERLLADARDRARTNVVRPQVQGRIVAANNEHLPEIRASAPLKAFPNTAEGRRNAYMFGRFIAAAIFNHEDSRRFLREYAPDVYGALSTGTGSAGGYLVPEQFEATILELVQDYGVARQYAQVFPMTRDNMVIPTRVSGVTAAAVAENAAITESDPTFGQVNVVAGKWAVLTRVSSELAEDAFVSMGDYLAREFALAFAQSEDDLVFNGTGAAAYNNMKGIRQEIIDNAAGSIVTAPTGETSWSTLTLNTLRKVVATLPQWRGSRPRWFLHSYGYFEAMLRVMAAASGNTIVTLQQGPDSPPMFLGYEVVFTNVLEGPTVGVNDTPLLFGDLSQVMVIGERRGITISVDSSRYFELDQIAIKGTRRLGVKAHHIGDASKAGGMILLKMAAA
ncbi:MAG: hypothetical protein KatS3mg038_2270 [Candidatus Kapaibacterium sp.]|nr:MAG: hypothetical protein KatS3mg038_0839 [Candidatus Kapabacteria bacterium]GIV51071.1 MAG: hypothetical protein KatS3mg038_1592 [Candidatus Kapabacteria bacterium]GIV51175.1 MAG: hypothetical protein KatS3mg038_1696 [Candidatus Kapabacteria bacterium]GIV51749.1 MAG: hypothetical protein KatS3mg038_2270 [Candidatus Kapabacteria bacterium]